MRKTSLRPAARERHTASEAGCPCKRRTVITLLAAALLCLFSSGVRGQSPEICRVGFTHEVFGDVNENDAMAAMRAWSRAFMEERKIPATMEPRIIDEIPEMKAALIEKTVDALNLTTPEFSQLQEFFDEDIIICGITSGSINEEYVLLVNRSSSIKELGDLEGRNLGMLSSVRASLAMTWVDTLLLREGLATAETFFGRIDRDMKVDNLLIPLFFGKLDACVITRRGFDLMVELNPQTGQRLEVLATSPPVVPQVFCFRKDWDSSVRKSIVTEIQYWHLSPAGQQSLSLFQIDGLEAQPISGLDTTLDLIEEHRALMENGGASHPSKASTAGLRENSL